MRKGIISFLVSVFLFVLVTITFAQSPQITPLSKLYYELKALLEKPDVDLNKAIGEILQKYAPIVEPILPPGQYEEYSLGLSELDRALKELGIWITRATVEIFNQEIVEGPFELNYDRETGQATGLITKLKTGKYNVIVKVFGLIDNKDERIVAYGRKDSVEVVRDKISLANIPLNIVVGTGAVLVNALLDFQNSEFTPGDVVAIEPEDGQLNVLPTVTLKWDSLRARLFDLYFGEEGELELKEINYFDKQYTIEGLKPSTTYQWRITAKNAFGQVESPVFSFRTGDAPTAPENPVPYDGAKKIWIEPVLLWESERAVSFDIYFGKSATDLALIGSSDGNMFELPQLDLGTTYFWKVIAKNAFGEAEGPVWAFTTGDVPTKPVLKEPVGEKVWLQPTFKWESEEAYEYEIYFGEKYDDMQLIATTTELEYTLPYELPMDTTYFWKVVAKNDFGENVSDVEMFKTGKAPDVIGPIQPLDGEEDVWKSPTLEWEFECADTYDVYLGKSIDELELITQDATENAITVEELELGTTYYWKVVGKNRFGETESPIWKFTVGNVPATPFNPEPPDGAVDQFNNLVLRWESSKADRYDLYIGFTPDKLDIYKTDIVESAVELYDLLFGVTYYWKVVAKNRFGNSEGPVWKFTTGQIPEKPEAIYPKDGDTEVPLNISLKWKSERAEEFDLYFGTILLDPLGTTTSTEYTLPTLHYGTWYNWKVVARNKFGEIESDFTFRTKLPTVEKQQSLGGTKADTGKKFIKASDGGYILVGNTQSSELPDFKGESDIIVIKLNKDLDVEWTKLIGGTGWEEATDVVETKDGYVVLGYTASTEVDGQKGKGGWDYLVAKLDKSGNTIWTRLYGGTGNDIAYKVIETSDGDYLIAGTTNSVNGDTGGNIGTWDAWLIKIDQKGDIIASKVFGGLDRDKAIDAMEVADGYIIAGVTYSLEGNIPYNHGSSDIWLFKVTKDLNTITLNKAYGGSDQDEVSKIFKAKDGNLMLIAYTTSVDGDVQKNAGYWDFWVIKIDMQGNIIWQKTYGGSEEDVAYSGAEFADGGFMIVGHTLSKLEEYKGGVDILVIDIDEYGNLRWQKTYGGTLADYAYDVYLEEDGTAILVGTTFSKNSDVGKNIGGSDIWIFKIK
uniref:Fibronectin type-III domain-containing protein n=1 Tax=Fervidobacterium nodosum TaxID=2424 RepID=A0A7C5Y796_9BACT